MPTQSAANVLGSPALDSWLDSWHSVHTIVSVTDSLRKGRKEGEGSVEKCGTPGGLWAPPRSGRDRSPEAGAREQGQEMREGSHAECAAPGEYLGVALQRDPKESEQRPHLALVHCEGRRGTKEFVSLDEAGNDLSLAGCHARWFAVIPGIGNLAGGS